MLGEYGRFHELLLPKPHHPRAFPHHPHYVFQQLLYGDSIRRCTSGRCDHPHSHPCEPHPRTGLSGGVQKQSPRVSHVRSL